MSANTIKQNIKSSALELFNTKGFEATSIRDLSSKADCSLPMMYYYYESKEKLLYEIVATDFIEIINGIFLKAYKTGNLRQFVISFVSDILALSGSEKQTVQIALRLHMGSPKHEELNKIILQYKYSKENSLKDLLINTWRTDKNIETKTHLTFDIIYNAMIAALLTNRPVSVKQAETDILFLLQD